MRLILLHLTYTLIKSNCIIIILLGVGKNVFLDGSKQDRYIWHLGFQFSFFAILVNGWTDDIG